MTYPIDTDEQTETALEMVGKASFPADVARAEAGLATPTSPAFAAAADATVLTSTPGGVAQLVIIGTGGNDTLTGTEGDDNINGVGGNDTIFGLGGNDTISGGSGAGGNFIDSGNGNDSLTGFGGNDTLIGGEGNDVLFGGNSRNGLDGGIGNDFIAGGSGTDSIDGSDGNDVLNGIQSTSSLMEDLYAATLDPTCWGNALESMATFIGGPGACLWLETAEIAPYLRYFNPPDFWQRQLSTHHEGEGPPHNSSDCFFAGNVTCDVAARRMEIVFCEHPVAPGWSDGTVRVLARFAVYRPGYSEGWVEPATRRMGIIFPHIRRAVEICQEIVINRAAIAAFEDTLDGMDAGIFLVNALGRMVDANSNGDAMLKQGRLVGSARGELIAYKRKTISLPGESFMPGNGRGAGYSEIDALELDAEIDSKHYVAHPFPISTTGDGMDGDDRMAVTGVVLREVTLPVDETVEKISRHFRLADRQRQVLRAIVDGYALTKIAEKLAIAPSTTKTHLQRLLKKTGTKSQTDLIKLCAAFRSPFAGASDAR